MDLGKESRDSFARALQPASPSRVALGHTAGRQIAGAKLATTLRGHSKPLILRCISTDRAESSWDVRAPSALWLFLQLPALGAAPAQGIQPAQPADVLGQLPH